MRIGQPALAGSAITSSGLPTSGRRRVIRAGERTVGRELRRPCCHGGRRAAWLAHRLLASPGVMLVPRGPRAALGRCPPVRCRERRASHGVPTAGASLRAAGACTGNARAYSGGVRRGRPRRRGRLSIGAEVGQREAEPIPACTAWPQDTDAVLRKRPRASASAAGVRPMKRHCCTSRRPADPAVPNGRRGVAGQRGKTIPTASPFQMAAPGCCPRGRPAALNSAAAWPCSS